MSQFIECLIRSACAEVGVKESGSSNRGPRVDDYQRATGWPVSMWGAWCAAFVCFCVMRALEDSGIRETKGFTRPKTGRAFDFEKWSLAQDDSTQTRKPCGRDIKRGDIIIFSFSHIGIALSPPDSKGMVDTVEGNSNAHGSRSGGMVVRQSRNASLIRSRIRFTI